MISPSPWINARLQCFELVAFPSTPVGGNLPFVPSSPARMALRRFNQGGKKQKELTEEQKQEINKAFDLFDTDGSGDACSGFRTEEGRNPKDDLECR